MSDYPIFDFLESKSWTLGKQIKDSLGLSKSTVYRQLKLLEKLEMIEKKPANQVMDYSDWRNMPDAFRVVPDNVV